MMTNGSENLGSLFMFSVVLSNIYAHVHLEYFICFPFSSVETYFERKPDRFNLYVILLYAIAHNIQFIPVRIWLIDY